MTRSQQWLAKLPHVQDYSQRDEGPRGYGNERIWEYATAYCDGSPMEKQVNFEPCTLITETPVVACEVPRRASVNATTISVSVYFPIHSQILLMDIRKLELPMKHLLGQWRPRTGSSPPLHADSIFTSRRIHFSMKNITCSYG
jgi:hypothetical protein